MAGSAARSRRSTSMASSSEKGGIWSCSFSSSRVSRGGSKSGLDDTACAPALLGLVPAPLGFPHCSLPAASQKKKGEDQENPA